MVLIIAEFRNVLKLTEKITCLPNKYIMTIPNPVNDIPTISQKLVKLRMATFTAAKHAVATSAIIIEVRIEFYTRILIDIFNV